MTVTRDGLFKKQDAGVHEGSYPVTVKCQNCSAPCEVSVLSSVLHVGFSELNAPKVMEEL